MREHDGGGDRAARTVLSALAALDDAMLRAVIVHAQTQLLDRPIPAGHPDELVVEIVDRAETLLLRDYRALDPATQREMRAIIGQRTRRERVRSSRQSPGVVLVRTDAAWPWKEPRVPDAHPAGPEATLAPVSALQRC